VHTNNRTLQGKSSFWREGELVKETLLVCMGLRNGTIIPDLLCYNIYSIVLFYVYDIKHSIELLYKLIENANFDLNICEEFQTTVAEGYGMGKNDIFTNAKHLMCIFLV
jgi:hypothetical protein